MDRRSPYLMAEDSPHFLDTSYNKNQISYYKYSQLLKKSSRLTVQQASEALRQYGNGASFLKANRNFFISPGFYLEKNMRGVGDFL